MKAIHPNRTISLAFDFVSNEKNTWHSSKIELAENVWFGYDLEVMNHSSSADVESQEIVIKISYPTRNLSLGGMYLATDNSLDSNLTAQWFKKNEQNSNDEEDNEVFLDAKSFQTSFQWKNHGKFESDEERQTILLTLKHPSFDSDVKLKVKTLITDTHITFVHLTRDNE